MRTLDKGKGSNDFTDADIEAIYAAGSRRHYAPGEVIIHKGDKGDSMYVIISGEAEVVFDDERGSKPMTAVSVRRCAS
jgi:CRP-like cAMP-binding protein